MRIKTKNTDTEIPGESLEKLNTRSVGTSFSWSAKAVLALYDGNDEVTQDSLVPSAEGNGDIVIEITSNEKAKISGVPKPKAGSVAYVIKATYTGDYGLSGTTELMQVVTPTDNNALQKEFENQLQAPKLILERTSTGRATRSRPLASISRLGMRISRRL